MGYYMGDFYAGARGDPGFFSFLGGLAKKAVGIASSFIPGAGPVAGALSKVTAAAGPMLRRGVGTLQKHPVLSAAGAAGAIAGAGMMRHRGSAAGAGMAAGRGAMGRVPGMRHRRMRVTNPKALRRAIRRAEGFKRLALRVLRFTGPHKPRGHAYFKPRKKKRI